MKIAIFGASGATGRIVIQKALESGHEVIACIHPSANFRIRHKKFIPIPCEVNNFAAIEKVIKGADAVISIFGPKRTSVENPVSQEMKTIIKAMKSNGVKRLIATATPMAIDRNDKFDLKFKLAAWMIKLLMPDFYKDILSTSEIIRNSDLDWTIVRIPILTNRILRKKIVTGYIGDGKIALAEVNRSEVAVFLLSQINDKNFLCKAPVIND